MTAPTRVTISTLRARKREGQKFAMITCYDYSTAVILQEAGVESVLVGDTYGEVCLGHSSTLPVKLDHLLTVTEAVRRGAPTPYLVGDMPFLTYQVNRSSAIRNAGRFLSEAGCDCVKLEVDRRLVRTVEAIATAGIPVMAHLGLKPQSIQTLGGYRIQGKTAQDAARIIEDARLMEEAGAVALLLEAVPTEVAAIITQNTSLPVIGIVSGPDCDGQVVVMHDMLGYSAGHPPRSVTPYANVHEIMLGAFRQFGSDVREKRFPQETGAVHMDAAERDKLNAMLPRILGPF